MPMMFGCHQIFVGGGLNLCRSWRISPLASTRQRRARQAKDGRLFGLCCLLENHGFSRGVSTVVGCFVSFSVMKLQLLVVWKWLFSTGCSMVQWKSKLFCPFSSPSQKQDVAGSANEDAEVPMDCPPMKIVFFGLPPMGGGGVVCCSICSNIICCASALKNGVTAWEVLQLFTAMRQYKVLGPGYWDLNCKTTAQNIRNRKTWAKRNPMIRRKFPMIHFCFFSFCNLFLNRKFVQFWVSKKKMLVSTVWRPGSVRSVARHPARHPARPPPCGRRPQNNQQAI